MRKIVRTAWTEVVMEMMESEFPDFKLQPVRKFGDAGMLKFIWHACTSLWLVIAFRPLDDESFDAFAGWSTTKEFPMGKFQDSDPSRIDDFSSDHFITWTMFFVPREGLSYWRFWEPPEEALDDPELFLKWTQSISARA